MVDEGRVARLLRATAERVERLRAARTVPDAERSDQWLDAVKYNLVAAVEGCIDVAQHIVASERFGVPSTNADAVRALGRHGALDPDLANRLGRAVGFRNVLVHQYVDVDDALVYDALDRLGDLDAFVEQISRFLLR
jgi:uncharacterized protein YutE (UPF0331/DUF86 family)